MTQARLKITIPEEVWIGQVTREHPDAVVRILAALSDEETGTGLAEISAPDMTAVVEEMAAYEDVTALEVITRGDRKTLVQFETTMPLLLLPARDSGVPLEMPFEIQDGTATWDVTAPSDRLSELGSQLEAFDITYTVEQVQQYPTEEPLLTDRQRRILQAAIAEGYYDTPRECSLTDLAERLEIAKSTASEMLHRAEGKVVKRFAEGLDDADQRQPAE